MNIGSIVFMWFIAPFGTLAVAGHNLVSRVDMLVMLPAFGLGSREVYSQHKTWGQSNRGVPRKQRG